MPIGTAVSHRQNLPTAQMNLAYIPITLDAMSSKQEENTHE